MCTYSRTRVYCYIHYACINTTSNAIAILNCNEMLHSMMMIRPSGYQAVLFRASREAQNRYTMIHAYRCIHAYTYTYMHTCIHAYILTGMLPK